MMFGLRENTIATVQGILHKHPSIERAIIYGSRVKGTHRRGSDIDLTLVGRELGQADLVKVMSELYDSPIPYTVHLSLWHQLKDPSLRAHIERRGQVFYDRSTYLP